MSHLINVDELVGALDHVVLLDVRWTLSTAGTSDGAAQYAAGHLPGAHFVDLDAELAAPPGDGGRHPLPDPAVVQAMIRRAGIDESTPVVVYDGQESFAAARAWWILRWAGLTDVRVLDGGYAAWERADLPVSTQIPEPRDSEFVVRPGSMPTVDADGAAAWPETGVLLDARAPERFRGEVEPIDPVAGHIPGATNSPTTEWLQEDGTFRPDLADHWTSVIGDDTGKPVAVYCGSGVTAAHQALALAELGIDTTLYPGSWSEWVRDPNRPVATT